MAEHPNAAAVRRLFEAFEARNIGAIQAAIPEDCVWRFPGRRGGLAGEHRGRAAILQFLGRVAGLTVGTFHLDLHDITASDDHVVALFTGHARRDGKELNNPTCLRVTMVEGRLSDIWEFVWDLDHVEDFWS
jgi:ketosteroid isomerase-like protein